jgi:hypothetical protein
MRHEQRRLPATWTWLDHIRERLRAASRALVPRADTARRSFLIGASVSALTFAAGCATSVRARAPVQMPEPVMPEPIWPAAPVAPPQPLRGPASSGEETFQDVLPAFPWQPPRPSARLELTVFNGPEYTTLGRIADGLAGAAKTAGLTDVTYFSVPGGFAILLRPERIDATLAPLVPRYDNEEGNALEGLFSFLSGVFASTIDRRQFAFIVTNRTIEANADLVDYTPSQLEKAFGRGAKALPASVRLTARPAGCKVTAMVYHFRRQRDDRLNQSFASASKEPVIAREHLTRAGLAGLA